MCKLVLAKDFTSSCSFLSCSRLRAFSLTCSSFSSIFCLIVFLFFTLAGGAIYVPFDIERMKNMNQ